MSTQQRFSASTESDISFESVLVAFYDDAVELISVTSEVTGIVGPHGPIGPVGLTGPTGIRGADADAAVSAQMAAALLSGSIITTLAELADVNLTGASQGSLLTLSGAQWVPTNLTVNQVYDGGNF